MVGNRNGNGCFVTFEGPEGSGKSTQIRLLAEYLRGKGLPITTSREPGGTEIGEIIRELVHDSKHTNMASTTEALLYQASRAQLVDEVIRPAIEGGKIVLLDRYGDSSLAYQGDSRGFGQETIKTLNRFSTGGLTPDLTFLIDIPVRIGLERRGRTDEVNRMDMQSIEFYESVRRAYLRMVEEDTTGRWIVVDGSRDIKEVNLDIVRFTEARLVAKGLLEGNRRVGPERF